MRKGEEEQGTRVLRAITQVLLGGVIATAVCIVFLLICAFAVSGGLFPQSKTGYLTVAACILGSLVGGFFAVRRCGSRSLIVGIVTGAALFLILLTAGLLLYQSAGLEEGGVPLACGCLCGGALAGFLGSPKKKRRK